MEDSGGNDMGVDGVIDQLRLKRDFGGVID